MKSKGSVGRRMNDIWKVYYYMFLYIMYFSVFFFTSVLKCVCFVLCEKMYRYSDMDSWTYLSTYCVVL